MHIHSPTPYDTYSTIPDSVQLCASMLQCPQCLLLCWILSATFISSCTLYPCGPRPVYCSCLDVMRLWDMLEGSEVFCVCSVHIFYMDSFYCWTIVSLCPLPLPFVMPLLLSCLLHSPVTFFPWMSLHSFMSCVMFQPNFCSYLSKHCRDCHELHTDVCKSFWLFMW
jgi:hypothetical protein